MVPGSGGIPDRNRERVLWDRLDPELCQPEDLLLWRRYFVRIPNPNMMLILGM